AHLRFPQGAPLRLAFLCHAIQRITWPRIETKFVIREQEIHGPCSLPMKCRSHMAVGIEGQLDGAVTEEVLNHLRMRACFQQHASGAVSKVVDPDTGQARMMQSLRERPIDYARAYRVTMSV